MASAGGNIYPPNMTTTTHIVAAIAGLTISIAGLSKLYTTKKGSTKKENDDVPGIFKSMFLFAYSCFIKPHAGNANDSQQSHLESFYASQAGVYDKTRKALLHGREDMLALVAAQLKCKNGEGGGGKRIWVDVGRIILFCSMSICSRMVRLGVELDGISRQWPSSSTFPVPSTGSTWSTSRLRSVLSPGSGLLDWAGRMSGLSARMPGNSVLRTMKMGYPAARVRDALRVSATSPSNGRSTVVRT